MRFVVMNGSISLLSKKNPIMSNVPNADIMKELENGCYNMTVNRDPNNKLFCSNCISHNCVHIKEEKEKRWSDG